MIIYNVGTAWFPMKADAETARRNTPRSKQQPRGPELLTVQVEKREELCALLNAICQGGRHGTELPFVKAGNGAPATILPAYTRDPNWTDRTVPSFVPAFLAKDRR